jgi:hypothetical protein
MHIQPRNRSRCQETSYVAVILAYSKKRQGRKHGAATAPTASYRRTKQCAFFQILRSNLGTSSSQHLTRHTNCFRCRDHLTVVDGLHKADSARTRGKCSSAALPKIASIAAPKTHQESQIDTWRQSLQVHVAQDRPARIQS